MKKTKITWDDLRDIPAEDYTEGRVAVTGLVGGDVPVTGENCGGVAPYLTIAPRDAALAKIVFDALGLGLVREVEEHPHGLIPDELGAVIRVGDDVFSRIDSRWFRVGSISPWSHGEVQALADEHGFEVLVPAITDSHGFEVLVPQSRVAEAREEGRLAGIRNAHGACKSQAGFSYERAVRTQIERAFPEAFEAEEGDR